eukprot:TRINITY_DN9724_c0_g1_i1.p2 TRINITY_DN9724_c0_g1~~TRINITY_DN9724_c0_g1_i1.p2  ORF type:complete len:138 (+),score=27.61 TRINITY_DN9724_c0_g1_i1:84-497(+)
MKPSIVLFLAGAVFFAQGEPLVGAPRRTECDDHCQGVLAEVRGDVLRRMGVEGADEAVIEPISVSRQVVAGTNWHVHARIAGNEFQMVVFEPLPYTKLPPEVTSLQQLRDKQGAAQHGKARGNPLRVNKGMRDGSEM